MDSLNQNQQNTSVSRKKREEEFRRKLVLEVAESLFADQGYTQTTVADIAAKAEFAKGSIYQLFESKDEIFTEIVKSKLTSIIENVEKTLLGEERPVEKIRKVIHGKLRHFWENQDFARIFLNEFKGFHLMMNPEFAKEHEHEVIVFHKKIEKVIEGGRALGEFRNDISPATLMAALTGFTNGIIVRWLRDEGSSINYDEASRKVEEIFFHGALSERIES